MNQEYKSYFEITTPFFVFDQSVFKEEVRKLNIACNNYWNNFKICYSVKTNSFPPLLKYCGLLGIDAEVVSEDEYDLVLKAGHKTLNIVCNGPIKERSWVYRILDSDSVLNIDSKRELKFVCEYAKLHNDKNIEVGLRVNFDLDFYFPGELNSGLTGSRFGFSFENGELHNAIACLRQLSNIGISGIHIHVSTQTRSLEIYRLLVRKFVEIVLKYGLVGIKYLDIGGGFYGGLPGKPGWDDYLKAISSELLNNNFKPDDLKLILEPGVSLIGGSFSYFASVVDVKLTQRQRYVVIDGSRIHIDPLMHKNSYFFTIIRKNKPSGNQSMKVAEQELVGFTCLEKDRLFILQDDYALSEGDMIRFDKVGAYTMTLSPLFISYFPAVYFLKEDGRIECTRFRWTVNEYLQLTKI